MRSLRILIADGFVDFLDMMEQILRARGHEPLTAPSEHGTLEACTLFAPDVLLLDPALVANVPAFLIEARKRMPAGSRVVALVLDGEITEELVDGTMRKPFRVVDLLALLDTWFPE
jgi:CheY-like chemotaxis protein